MLNKILLLSLYKNKLQSDPMLPDTFEEPKHYSGWFYPIRHLLALRYLKIKGIILEEFRHSGTYPISSTAFDEALHRHLLPKNNKQTFDPSLPSKSAPSIWHKVLRAKFIYPCVISIVALTLFSAYQFHNNKQVENVLANQLPYFSDLLHRKLLLTHNNGNESQIERINQLIKTTEYRIINAITQQNGLRDSLQQQLEKLKDPSLDSGQLMLGFKALNTLFDLHQQPYYLSPKSYTVPCSSLIDAPVEQMMMLKELESLMSNNNPELCRTTMMTTYKVDHRTELFYQQNDKTTNSEVELPLFHVRRIDKVPAVDGALGLTFKDKGIGSIILTERIKNFSQESILPALTFQGRNYIIPYWMQGYYEIEEAVTKGYKKDITQIYQDKKEQRIVKTLVKHLIKDKSRMQNSKLEQTMQRKNSNNDRNVFGNGFDAISVLLGKANKNDEPKQKPRKPLFQNKNALLLKKLEHSLYPSIEHHEAYHQIDKSNWQQPAWIATTFKEQLNDNALEHTMEELGAYLSQLANTEQGLNIWLSKLLIFSLNPMTQGQAEYYASSIILNAFESLYLGLKITPSYIATVDDKTRIFKVLLNKSNDEINFLARLTYESLFERKTPNLNYRN